MQSHFSFFFAKKMMKIEPKKTRIENKVLRLECAFDQPQPQQQQQVRT